ncbi:F-type H+-transporting ATPase subunit a [Cryobacterium mesophilum]|uniref:F0F1 ATP synthase subunit A n=1 Tax=Terrimesophilobacter mesophilus TaxID=433647 RepID=UPI0018332706|nr:F0F1 ATP synthase subunit A [Terrimesophilobacter mesophilus]MBB5633973.1 F-type H+-transporting ATPase subunit a [Terrimesophilobacter mesophilus]
MGPSINEFFPAPILFIGTPFELNRIMLIRLLAVAALLLILWLGTRRLKLVPGRGQVAMEFAIDFARKGIAIDTLGEKEGKRFAPLIMTIFFLTLALNVTGTIPGLQIASTGLIGQAIILSIIAYVTFVYAGIRKFGVGRFFKNALWLPGVPVAIKPIIAVLEVLSTFIVRPITLTLRLTMNMVAGHMLLVLCFLATGFFFNMLISGSAWGLIGAGTLLMGIAFVVLEIFVAALQAYIFAILTAIYIQLALADEH